MPEYFGRAFVLYEAREAAAPCGDNREALRQQMALAEEIVEVRALEEDSFSVALADPLGELAELHGRLCNHPAALKVYRRAVHRIRINEGLLSPTQVPYLQAMAASSRAIGDGRTAQRTMRHAFRVHGMGHGPLEGAALDDSLAYFRFARELYIDPRIGRDHELFFEALEDNVAMLEAQTEGGDGVTASYEVRRALTISHLQNLYLMLGTDLQAAYDYVDSGIAWEHMRILQVLGFTKGLRLLQALIDDPAAQDPLEQATLWLRRGNWQQWNSKWDGACESYGRAWHFAQEAGDEALLKRLASPAELPEDRQLWQTLNDPALAQRALIEAEFKVSRRGSISYVAAKVRGDGSVALAGRVARWLRDAHARPAVIDGACVDSQLTGRLYRLLD